MWHFQWKQDSLLKQALCCLQICNIIKCDIRALIEHFPLQHLHQIGIGSIAIGIPLIQETFLTVGIESLFAIGHIGPRPAVCRLTVGHIGGLLYIRFLLLYGWRRVPHIWVLERLRTAFINTEAPCGSPKITNSLPRDLLRIPGHTASPEHIPPRIGARIAQPRYHTHQSLYCILLLYDGTLELPPLLYLTPGDIVQDDLLLDGVDNALEELLGLRVLAEVGGVAGLLDVGLEGVELGHHRPGIFIIWAGG